MEKGLHCYNERNFSQNFKVFDDILLGNDWKFLSFFYKLLMFQRKNFVFINWWSKFSFRIFCGRFAQPWKKLMKAWKKKNNCNVFPSVKKCFDLKLVQLKKEIYHGKFCVALANKWQRLKVKIGLGKCSTDLVSSFGQMSLLLSIECWFKSFQIFHNKFCFQERKLG